MNIEVYAREGHIAEMNHESFGFFIGVFKGELFKCPTVDKADDAIVAAFQHLDYLLR